MFASHGCDGSETHIIQAGQSTVVFVVSDRPVAWSRGPVADSRGQAVHVSDGSSPPSLSAVCSGQEPFYVGGKME